MLKYSICSLLRTLQWKVLSSSTKNWSWCSWTPSVKTKKDFAFLTGSFSIIKSLNHQIYPYPSKRDYTVLWTYFLLLELFCSMYTKYAIVFFHFSWGEGGGRFEVLKLLYFKLLCQRHIQNLSNIWDGAFCWKLLSLFK